MTAGEQPLNDEPASEPGSTGNGDKTTTPSSGEPAAGGERVDPRVLEMLVCPVTKATLEYDAEKQELVSRRANLAFPIRSGVPLLTREAARPLDD